jgi:ATP-dependent RNA helicase RhlE
MSFQNLGLIEPILKALETEGYSTPTPIQAQAIPQVLERRDLLGCAQTGTGKTAAFSLPVLQLLHERKAPHKHIRVLVLTPTRELAIQINDSLTAYGRHLHVGHTVIFGGVSQHGQTEALRKHPGILVATPGRLLDLMQQRYVDLSHIEIFILDEADRMLDMGFINDVKRVIAKLPSRKQTLFFSATMPPEIQKLSDSLLHNPLKVEVTPPSSTVDKIEQSLYYTNRGDKVKLLIHLLKELPIKNALVFTRTKHGADKVVRMLLKSGINAAAIHGNKSQNQRQNALNNFKDGKIRILVATDIAARGIDIDELPYVFNCDLPEVPETYVHRIGRTGRAGLSGRSISFCDQEQLDEWKAIRKLIGKDIEIVQDHPFPMDTTAAPAPKSKPSNQNRPPRRDFRRR